MVKPKVVYIINNLFVSSYNDIYLSTERLLPRAWFRMCQSHRLGVGEENNDLGHAGV